jgi:hypothetical protein
MNNSFDINNLNSFIQQASQTIMCDSQCQRNKLTEKLKQKYLDAKQNLNSADYNVELAEKNYVTFAKGELAYNELKDQQLHKKAELITDKFENNFDLEVNNIKTQINSYDGLLINFKNVVDLFLTYKKENVELLKEIKDDTNDVLTNERKTYYQDQGIENLNFFYYKILLTIYVIFVISFIILSFIYPSNIQLKTRIIISIVLIILPIISTSLLENLIHAINSIYNLLPKNAHLN